LTWESCGEGLDALECTSVSAPLDYNHPRGEQTTLALARVPASDPANKIGTVFLNPGGPGASGIDLVLFGFGEALGELLDGRFDIVGFDPRGVAASDPVHCFDNADEFNAFFPSDLPIFPYKREQERPFYRAYSALGPQCHSRGQRIISHMSTADVARDLDLLRRAVGDSKLTYLGFSYGSYIGMTYANMFPNKVRSLVIDGVLDPRLWSSGWQIETDRIAAGEEFEEFLRLCDEAGENCYFHVKGGSSARYEALANSLRQEPLDLGGFLYTYDYLIADSADALYSPEYWGGPGGYADLFDLIADAVLGDQKAAQAAATVRKAIRQRIEQDSPRRTDYDNGFDAYLGNMCADIGFPVNFPAYHLIGRYAEEGSRIGPAWWWGNAACALWPAASDRYIGPWSTRTSQPALVIGNYFDGVTSYAGAVGSSKLLRNSRLLSYAGWGHTAFGRSECVTDHVVEYLKDGTLPPKGTVCEANPNPFLPELAMRKSTASKRLPMIGLPPLRPR
jgi:pimeloyl-ACP methyl ester carboxylesterase